MNKKGFIELDEINPLAVAGGVVCAAVAWYVDSSSGANILFRVLTIPLGLVIGYFVTLKLMGD